MATYEGSKHYPYERMLSTLEGVWGIINDPVIRDDPPRLAAAVSTTVFRGMVTGAIEAGKRNAVDPDPATEAMKAAYGEIGLCSDECETEAGCTFRPDGSEGACGGRAFYLLDQELKHRGVLMEAKEG